jgi:hypothetical protein
VLLVAALMLASCSSSGGQSEQGRALTTFPPATSPSTTGPSSNTLVRTIGNGVAQWLSGLSGPAGQPLDCPYPASDSTIVSSNDNARGCVQWWQGRYYATIQNLSSLPLTIQGAGIYTWTLPPGQTQTLGPITFSYGNSYTFRPQLQPAVTAAVFNFALGKLVKTPPAVAWRPCLQSLTPNCLIDALVKLLPQYVDIGRYHVPVKEIAGVMSQIWGYLPLLNAWRAQQAGTSTGHLTICDYPRRYWC